MITEYCNYNLWPGESGWELEIVQPPSLKPLHGERVRKKTDTVSENWTRYAVINSKIRKKFQWMEQDISSLGNQKKQ